MTGTAKNKNSDKMIHTSSFKFSVSRLYFSPCLYVSVVKGSFLKGNFLFDQILGLIFFIDKSRGLLYNFFEKNLIPFIHNYTYYLFFTDEPNQSLERKIKPILHKSVMNDKRI